MHYLICISHSVVQTAVMLSNVWSALCTDGADSCTLNAVCFLTQSEVAAVNCIGQFKIWDVRQQSAEPVRVFVP